MSFRYPSHQIQDLVQARKAVRNGQSLEFKNYKESSLTLSLDLDLLEGGLVTMRLAINAARSKEPQTYRAALLLDEERIRGVDHRELAQKKFYKITIPAGWHQNLIDPNLTGDDSNRHVPLADFQPTDLTDFLHKVTALWQIDLRPESKLL